MHRTVGLVRKVWAFDKVDKSDVFMFEGKIES